MGILQRFGFNKTSQEAKPIDVTNTSLQNITGGQLDLGSLKLSSFQTDLPKIFPAQGKDWVNYGTKNNYPEYLKELFNTSPTHQAIVKTKSLMVAGDGYAIETSHLDEEAKIKVMQIINQVTRQLHETSLDQQIYGAFAYEIVWSLDLTKIIKINRVDPANLRSGKLENNFVDCWFWSRDWSNNKEEVKEIYSFEESDGENHRQLLYVPSQMVDNDYYGEPSYLASIDWINLESSTGLYYKSLLANGFNPSLLIKFYRKPVNKEERDEIVSGLSRTYGGVKNSGKAMVLFSDGKELAPDVDPIAAQNVDKQFTVIAEQITQKIMIGHRVTSTELVGLNYQGQLGQGDFDQKMKVFNKIVIRPEQKLIEETVNRILLCNGFDVNFKLKSFNFNDL